MNGKDKREEMVWHGLRVAVYRVEGMRGEGGGDNPFVVRFVDVFVDERDMQPAVKPVDAVVRKEEEATRGTRNYG